MCLLFSIFYCGFLQVVELVLLGFFFAIGMLILLVVESAPGEVLLVAVDSIL